MSGLHLFAGGNTSAGFFSCFEDIMPKPARRRMFYLKGGPGVGKSTMMRRMAQAAEAAGQPVEYFHCSSDPDSLDGIALPRLGWAMMDGTAPHVYDPVTPGARDTLVSLGDFLDERAMQPKAKQISALQEEISLRFSRCYSFLSAAGQLGRLCAGQTLREDRLNQLAQEWTAALPRRGGRGVCLCLHPQGTGGSAHRRGAHRPLGGMPAGAVPHPAVAADQLDGVLARACGGAPAQPSLARGTGWAAAAASVVGTIYLVGFI